MIKSNAQKIRDYNFPEEHFVADRGGTFIDLGQPPNVDKRLNANPNIIGRGLW